LTGKGQYAFPGARSRERFMSENTVNGALRRLGWSGSEMTGHGFRSMACEPVLPQAAFQMQNRRRLRSAFTYNCRILAFNVTDAFERSVRHRTNSRRLAAQHEFATRCGADAARMRN